MQHIYRVASYALIVVVIAILGLWAYQRNSVYRSGLSLWMDNAAKSPNKTRVLFNLAYECKQAGMEREGIITLTRAFTIDPDLIYYLKALKYADENGGRLITEKDPWNSSGAGEGRGLHPPSPLPLQNKGA